MILHSIRKSTVLCCTVAVVGVLASVWVSRALRIAGDGEIRAHFQSHAVELSTEIEHGLLEDLSAIESMGAIIAAQDVLSADEFERFASHYLNRYPSLRAIGWNPVVRETERAAFEMELRQRNAAHTNITERSLAGVLVPASARSEYVVVKYIAPYAGNEEALGYDVGSESRRREALENAAETGEIGVSAQIALVQEEGAPGFLAFRPVYRRSVDADTRPSRESLAGFAVGVFEASDVVASATSAIAREGLSVTIKDVTDVNSNSLLYQSPLTREVGVEAETALFFEHVESFEHGGREWRVEFSAGPAVAAELRSRAPIVALIVGLTITVLVTALLFFILRSNSALAREIARRREVEDERRRLDAKLREAQKLESLGLFAGGIAHEFNNLLTGILGGTELALESVAAVEPVREDLEAVRVAAIRAADLTAQMLSYTGYKPFKPEALDLAREIVRMKLEVELAVPAHVDLRYDLSPDAMRIEGDPVQIRQLVINVVTNALEASTAASAGDAREVVVRTGIRRLERETLESAHFGETLVPGPHAFVEVSDQGCGMTPEDQARAFDPFFTTKFSGRGLGLSVVMGIVRSHRGAIWVETTPGMGSRFTAVFPLFEPTADKTIDHGDYTGLMH